MRRSPNSNRDQQRNPHRVKQGKHAMQNSNQNAAKHPFARLMTATLGAMAISIAVVGFAGPGAASDAVAGGMNDHVTVHVIKHDSAKATDKDRTILAITSGCKGQAKRVDSETETKDESGKIEKTRVILCDLGGADDSDLLTRLLRARARIAGEQALSGTARQKAIAVLDREIAQLKGAPGYSRQ
jgi:hypothetical protein